MSDHVRRVMLSEEAEVWADSIIESAAEASDREAYADAARQAGSDVKGTART